MTAYHAKKRLGQNFLVSSPVIQKIVDAVAVAVGAGQTVIEIGAGRGALTTALAETGAKVIAIEFDSDVIPYLRKLMRRQENVEILHRDFLSYEPDATITPGFVLAGNLPYNITSPVIDWCVRHHSSIDRAVFMVQKEMAARIGAQPGSRGWSPLSIFTQMYFDVVICFDVPPDSFRPRPEVTSTVIKLTARTPEKIEHFELFERVVRASFTHRRKLLKNNLVPDIIPDASEAGRILAELGLGSDCRAEELTTGRFLDLTKALIRYNIQ